MTCIVFIWQVTYIKFDARVIQRRFVIAMNMAITFDACNKICTMSNNYLSTVYNPGQGVKELLREAYSLVRTRKAEAAAAAEAKSGHAPPDWTP